MGTGGTRAAVMVLACLVATPAAAQSLDPGPPGPWVVDVRGVLSGLPTSEAFYPGRPAGTSVPARGFGIDVGGHVYPFRFAAARIGLGADVLIARGSALDVSATLTTVAPQMSFNFGSSDGWSYLTVGLGVAHLAFVPGESTNVRSLNFGGGARWFTGPHLGIGFDIRFHRMAEGGSLDAPTPAFMPVTVAVGLSLK